MSFPKLRATFTLLLGLALFATTGCAATLTGVLSTGATLGTISVFTRAGEVTYTTLVPTPR
jgi:hypothetical protein